MSQDWILTGSTNKEILEKYKGVVGKLSQGDKQINNSSEIAKDTRLFFGPESDFGFLMTIPGIIESKGPSIIKVTTENNDYVFLKTSV